MAILTNNRLARKHWGGTYVSAMTVIKNKKVFALNLQINIRLA
jgi:hypothetical protein